MKRPAIWFARIVVAAAALLFTAIGAKFILDPTGAAAGAGLAQASSVGLTTIRAGLGGFAIGFALILASCVFRRDRVRDGLAYLSLLIASVLAVRLASAFHDGTLAQSAHLIAPETMLLVLALVGIALTARSTKSVDKPALRD